MKTDIKVWLTDIEIAITEIEAFLPKQRNFIEFQKDIKAKRAIERNIEIIGEAVNRIIGIDPGIAISNTRKIVDTRNRIIHGYDSVSEEILWAIIVKDLPLLKNEVMNLLSK